MKVGSSSFVVVIKVQNDIKKSLILQGRTKLCSFVDFGDSVVTRQNLIQDLIQLAHYFLDVQVFHISHCVTCFDARVASERDRDLVPLHDSYCDSVFQSSS